MKTLIQHIQEKLVVNKDYTMANKFSQRLYYLCFCIGRSSSNNLLNIFVYDVDKTQEMADDRVTVNVTKCTNNNSKDKEFFVFDYDTNTDVLYNKIKITGKQYLHSCKIELCFTDRNEKIFKELCEFLLDNNYYVSAGEIFAKLNLTARGKLKKIIDLITFKNKRDAEDGFQKYRVHTTCSYAPLSWVVDELLK